MSSQIYMTAKEIAAMLHICERTLYSYVEDQRIPQPVWLGGKRLWVSQVVHDFVASSAKRKGRKTRTTRKPPLP
jgi:predicted DNA-binding transcriptional regulator AlpA